MTSDLNWIVPDRLVEIIFSGDLVIDDVMVLHRLDLSSKTKPVHILANEYNVRLAVPEGVLKILDQMDVRNPMIGYITFCGSPAVIEIFTKLVLKLAGMKGKVAFYPTREQALAKLEEILAQELA